MKCTPDELLDLVVRRVVDGEMLSRVCRDVGIAPSTVRKYRAAELPKNLATRSHTQFGRERSAAIPRGEGFRASILPSRKVGKY